MVNNYKISNVSTISDHNNSVPRNVTLSVGSRSLDHISKCTERTTDLRTIEHTGDSKVLNECYIDLTLSKLRELDSNRNAQDQYILSRSKFLNKNLINVLMIKLRLEGNEVLNELDYEYLNSLLSWSRNDIYIMPLLEFEDRKRTDMVSSYDEFVKKMLEEKNSWIDNNIKIGISIPHMYPRRNIGGLFELFSDVDPTFVAVDFNNSRMDRPSDVTGTILKHFDQNNEENTFLYGVNVKPYKRGAENTSAWDIYMVHGAFNAIGPTHSKPRSIVLPADWNKMGRMFDSDSVEYRVIDVLLCVILGLVYAGSSLRIRNVADAVRQAQCHVCFPDACHLYHVTIYRALCVGIDQRIGISHYRIAYVPKAGYIARVNVVVRRRQLVVCTIFAECAYHQLVYLLPLVSIRYATSLYESQLELRIHSTRSRVVGVSIHVAEVTRTSCQGDRKTDDTYYGFEKILHISILVYIRFYNSLSLMHLCHMHPVSLPCKDRTAAFHRRVLL